MDQLLLSVQRTGPAREATLMGRPYRVFPAVLVREQVLHNNLGRTFLPAAEIADSVDAWNGMPVVVRHPSKRGQPVSARSPDVLNAHGVGYVYHARFDAEDAALKGEVWVDLERAKAVADADTALNRVESGEPGEVSTGFSTMAVAQKGTFDGKEYDAVLRMLQPDHFALLVEETGACSVEDGCGLGVNCKGGCSCGGGSQNSEEGEPVPVNGEQEETGASAPDGEEAAAANAETAPPAPPPAKDPAAVVEDPTWKRLLNRALQAVGFPVEARNESDEDRRLMLFHALREAFGGPGRDIWVLAVFSDERTVVFEVDSQQDGVALFRSEFEVGEDGSVTLTDPVEVRKVTTFEPVANSEGDAQEEEEVMNRQEMIAQLQEVCPLKAERLEALEDAELTALHESYAGGEEPAAGETATEPTGEGAAEEPEETAEAPTAENAAPDTEAVNRLLSEVEDLRKQREEDRAELAQLREVTSPAVEERKRAREELVSSLAANDRVAWNKEELESKSFEELRKIEALARGQNYAGRGGPKSPTANSQEAYLAPKPYWATNEKQADAKEGN